MRVPSPGGKQGFTLHLDIQEDLPALRADPDAMEQAILNLLTNAMKYSGDAREIDLRLRSRNGDAVIEVTDRGLRDRARRAKARLRKVLPGAFAQKAT